MTDFGLAGRVAVVTGGASGIGRAIALGLADAGAKVTVLDRDGDGASETARLISVAGGQCRVLDCDVSDPASVQAAANTIGAEDGPARILVNNAAIIRPGGLMDLALADWSALLSVNLNGYFICAQTFGRIMKASGGGSIVHNASIAARNPTPQTGAYSVAKAGVAMLSRQLAVEWGPFGIRSNCVSPGMILTPFSQSMYDKPGVREARCATIPARRIGEPDDIVSAVLFLASDQAAYITGADLGIDGGFAGNLLGLIPRAGYDAA